MPVASQILTINLKLIATYRRYLPPEAQGNTVELALPPDTPFEAVLTDLGVPLDSSSVILVNGHVPAPGQTLRDGDLLIAFPALAGG